MQQNDENSMLPVCSASQGFLSASFIIAFDRKPKSFFVTMRLFSADLQSFLRKNCIFDSYD